MRTLMGMNEPLNKIFGSLAYILKSIINPFNDDSWYTNLFFLFFVLNYTKFA